MKKHLRFLALLLALTLLLAACGKKKDPWREQYDLGVRYLSQGKYEEAILAFQAAIEIDPKRAESYIGLADAYEKSGDIDAAREALRRGLDETDDKDLQKKLDELDNAGKDPGGKLPGDQNPPGDLKQPEPDKLGKDEYIRIVSVEYDKSLVGHNQGTPTTIKLLYDTHGEEEKMEGYSCRIEIEMIYDDDKSVTICDISNRMLHVTGSGELEYRTRLVTFDGLRAVRLVAYVNNHPEYYNTLIPRQSVLYEFGDAFSGVEVPMPDYVTDVFPVEGNETRIDYSGLTISGTVVDGENYQPTLVLKELGLQYGYVYSNIKYPDAVPAIIGNRVVVYNAYYYLALDEPLVLPNGFVIDCVAVAGDYPEIGEHLTLTGTLVGRTVPPGFYLTDSMEYDSICAMFPLVYRFFPD